MIFGVNLLTGWTVAGWFARLLWAALAQTRAQTEFVGRAAAASRRPAVGE